MTSSYLITQIWLGASRYHVGSYWGASGLCPGVKGSWWGRQWPLPSFDLLTSGAQASSLLQWGNPCTFSRSGLVRYGVEGGGGCPAATSLGSRGTGEVVWPSLSFRPIRLRPQASLRWGFSFILFWWIQFLVSPHLTVFGIISLRPNGCHRYRSIKITN